MTKDVQVRVRIAPSPTGWLHVGTARTALFNFLFSRRNNGKFILRIEDTDTARSDQKYERDIIEGLKWLGIEWDEGPYRQSERTPMYRKYLEKLLETGKAFWCYHPPRDTPGVHWCEQKIQNEKLKIKNSRGGVIRFAAPGGGEVVVQDLVRGQVKFNSRDIGDFSIAKDLDHPLYNFAAVADDYEMKISHVVRGEDHLSNTPKQILIAEALGFESPRFAHLPLILGSDRSKLSKRHGATSIRDYRSQGYLASALVNFMALLGWNPGDTREILGIEELIKEFSLERVHKGGAVFNIEKLNSINRHYLRALSSETLVELCMAALQGRTGVTRDRLVKILEVERDRLTKISDISIGTEYYFEPPQYDCALLKWKDTPDVDLMRALQRARDIIVKVPEQDFKHKILSTQLLLAASELGDRGVMLWPMRVALTGKRQSPGPIEIAAVLGKAETIRRLERAIELLACVNKTT